MNETLLEVRGVSKRYPAVVALDQVNLRVRAGEIHALMGENGAGKSTLIKVITGAERANSGEIRLGGRPVAFRTPAEAQSNGLSTVYQEVNLIPSLSVAENVSLGRAPRTSFGLIDWKRMNSRAEAALAKLNLVLDVTRKLETYPIAIQQMVAIARALELSVKVLILDEPTSSLDSGEVRQLFKVMRELRERGIGIVFVTHFLDQVYEISDRITVLRNGRLVGEYETAKLPRIELVAKMMGRELEDLGAHSGKTARAAESRPLLSARNLGKTGGPEAIDLDVAAGEVVGLAGLLGSGRTEIARLLFGLDRRDRGEVRIGGKTTALRSPRAAIREGIVLLPEDRKAQAIFPELSILENIVVGLQGRRGWAKLLPRKAQAALARKYIDLLGVACADADQPIGTLSGGNQQKVILGRLLAAEPSLLILDEPTRGIDVGAKAEIQKLVRAVAEGGKAVLFISSDLEETVNCCDRVAVLRDRRKVGELSGDDVNAKEIMRAIADAGVSP